MGLQKEVWRPIVGFPGYMVSNMGRVKSLARVVKRGNNQIPVKEKFLKFGTSVGYPFVNLNREGVSTSVKVHRLVASAFVPNPNQRPEVDHINTIRTDNRAENLRWVNRSENNMNPITRERNSTAKKKKHGSIE